MHFAVLDRRVLLSGRHPRASHYRSLLPPPVSGARDGMLLSCLALAMRSWCRARTDNGCGSAPQADASCNLTLHRYL
eukprot:270328-Rhodomonas_salina.9